MKTLHNSDELKNYIKKGVGVHKSGTYENYVKEKNGHRNNAMNS